MVLKVSTLEPFGSFYKVNFNDGTSVLATPDSNELYRINSNPAHANYIHQFGNSMQVTFADGHSQICYPTVGSLFISSDVDSETPPPPPPPPPVKKLIDTISPGHHITNPGGTVASGWQWHVDNNQGRGGDDWNYTFQTFKAPGRGRVTHFDVPGVGMVVKLVLHYTAHRIDPVQPENDNPGPMKAIWFQHCSDANDGLVDQGDIIGTSGDGYGQYAPHLHVHGMVDTGNSAGVSNRTCFWDYV